MSKNSISVAEHFSAVPVPDSIDHLSGPLPFPMTNDVLFHIIFEANNTALRGLVCSLLRLKDSDIHSIEVQNPIAFGKTVFSKGFVLVLKLLLNNNTSINVEMQVLKFKHWTERSLSYLCRSYDKLNKGEAYSNTKAAIHIGILDYDLFPEDEARFYATYHLADDVTHKIYTGNFQLSVLYLNHVDKATVEDIACHLDYWAKFFKATTWEELTMLAEKSPMFTEVTKTVYSATKDIYAQTMLEAYEEYERLYNTIKDEVAEDLAELKQRKAELEQTKTELAQHKTELAQHKTELAQKESELMQKDAEIARLTAELSALKSNLN